MKSSTATGTTATADRSRPYRGRFAPSPTGPLHAGSLMTALASWLDARAHRGAWLVRMEDLDTPRNRPGADAAILETLQRLGLTADEPVWFQSRRAAHYCLALETLQRQGRLYRCICPRSEASHPYPGTCRDAGHDASRPGALRLRIDADPEVGFDDRIQGPVSWRSADLGDPVVLRRDGIAAYQLAVVVDDIAQGITDVVRGADLLESTPWQIQIARALGAEPPRYAHVPLLVEPDGQKLAKSRRSLPVDGLAAGPALLQALTLLGQLPPAELAAATPRELLEWGAAHWEPSRLRGQRTIPIAS